MSHRIELPEKLDQAAVANFRASLLEAAGQPVVIDARRARGVGGLCAQVLMAGEKEWRADSLPFQIEASEPFKADLERMGLERFISNSEAKS